MQAVIMRNMRVLLKKMRLNPRRLAVAGFLGGVLLTSACGGDDAPAVTVTTVTVTTVTVTQQAEVTSAAIAEVTATAPAPTATETPAAIETPVPTETLEPTEMPATETDVADATATTTSDEPASGELAGEIDSHGAQMVLVPAGSFELGWERLDLLEECEEFREGCIAPFFTPAGPPHQVNVDAFYIDVTEVTNDAFAAFLTEIGSHTGACFAQDCIGLDTTALAEEGEGVYAVSDPELGDHPVVGVTWFGAAAYCQWRGVRLPTNAEWEKAAAWDPDSGDKTRYPWGNTFDSGVLNFCDANCDAHNFADPDADDGYATTAPVGSYPDGQSPIGALDMAGNVWEWVVDWFDGLIYETTSGISSDHSDEASDEDSEEATEEPPPLPIDNPTGPESGELRVVRGGSWFDTGNFTASAFRAGIDPVLSDDTLGFRCVADG